VDHERRDNDGFDLRVVKDDEAISINAIQKDGQFDTDEVRVIGPDEAISDVSVHQVVQVRMKPNSSCRKKDHICSGAVGSGERRPSRVLAYSYPDEYHFYPRTRKRFDPSAMRRKAGSNLTLKIFRSTRRNYALPVPLWPYFAAAALVLISATYFFAASDYSNKHSGQGVSHKHTEDHSSAHSL